MLPDLHLLSTEHLKKLFAVQTTEFKQATITNVSADQLKSIELTLQQLTNELQGRIRVGC